jgi:hypothetical protein
MTVDLLHLWILAIENKMPARLILSLEMDFFCVLCLALMTAAFE